ncbi:hypothetical protein DNTS_003693 [Danionella cerebrum]|uniref:Uncharacterized protein n=1 Tax=Danionella cerebrum TaxID=2873325 RepID=A0A553QKW4_9TELE|nr:hypothetical protein DNTS_003693 [Danionella translucida]
MEQNRNEDNEQILEDCNEKCKEYLTSLFDESTAEYFLCSSSSLKQSPSWFSQIKDDMKDQVSAVALWDALRHRSVQILKESNAEQSVESINEISRRGVDWRSLLKQDHKKHLSRVKFMFHCAQRNQASSAFLLQQNPPIGYSSNKD